MSQVGSLRLVVHALDRTGPPMLALALLRWVREHHPMVRVDVVAFRGGDLRTEVEAVAPVVVLLRDREAWDHRAPDPARVADLHQITGALEPADRTLLVSVAAGQCLPYVPDRSVVTWCVEQGEDLHWVTDGVGLVERTGRWLAGAQGSRDELARLLDTSADIPIVPEFVEPPQDPVVLQEAAAACRLALQAGPHDLVVVGAGIATFRKAPDLFLEAALLHHRLDAGPARFVWIGGSQDELFDPLGTEVARLGLEDVVQIRPEVADLLPWLAAADVLLHPARLDAFPLVCLHAASVGTPVVAFSGVGGVPDMFGSAFLGAPFPDLRALVAVLDRLRDPSIRSASGRAQQLAVHGHLAPAAAPKVWAQLEGWP